MTTKFTYDVAIIGTGRVGLPLGLSLCKVGFSVIGVDRDAQLRQLVNAGKMPFMENGCDELLTLVGFHVFDDISLIAECKNIIITVGTPLLAHIETDLSQVSQVIDEICQHMQLGHNIILRSTVAPGTTEFVRKFIERETGYVVGKDVFLSFCPERIAEGKALTEIHTLPQLIGSNDETSYLCAEQIFTKLTSDIFKTDYISAELVKLFNNISRYVHFAVANHFMMISEQFAANFYEILHMANYKYPRSILAQPGFTAGTCLRKDFGMINESIPYTDLLLSAWKVNEYLPKFLVSQMASRVKIEGNSIAVLGYTFKKDTDDTRDSLVPKLIRYIEREVPKSLFVHDPFLPETIDGQYVNSSLETVLPKADIIFIGTNHSTFSRNFETIFDLAKPGAYFADIWNVSNKNTTIFQKQAWE